MRCENPNRRVGHYYWSLALTLWPSGISAARLHGAGNCEREDPTPCQLFKILRYSLYEKGLENIGGSKNIGI